MHNTYIKKPVTPLVQDPTLPTAVIVDIDGTVANISKRGPYEQHKVFEDGVMESTCEVVRLLHTAGHKIIYISGREEYCRDDTARWFKEVANLPCDLLLLNRTGETRSSTITKLEIFNKHIAGKYNVILVLEDRTKNVIVWRELGLLCYQVDEGHF